MNKDNVVTERANAQSEAVSRLDFLKSVGLGAGAAGIAAMMGGQAFADIEKKGKYVFIITNGTNDPNRAILALICARAVASKGWGDVHVWMTLQGAELSLKDKAARMESPIFKKYGTALELMTKIKEKGGKFGVCPPCSEYACAAGGDKLDYVSLAGADWLMKNVQDAWVLSL
ncbi:DsrE family protein [Geomonas sp.]|uniref:DsrE family protein n=1 Tax=Geomonas sp. TaxID=2651584 RepID=UPI002B47D911|nr:DsrE family protein [Geomonas sp.]HJV34626.1 DsrE family protein [Geomonas sp.]